MPPKAPKKRKTAQRGRGTIPPFLLSLGKKMIEDNPRILSTVMRMVGGRKRKAKGK